MGLWRVAIQSTEVHVLSMPEACQRGCDLSGCGCDRASVCCFTKASGTAQSAYEPSKRLEQSISNCPKRSRAVMKVIRRIDGPTSAPGRAGRSWASEICRGWTGAVRTSAARAEGRPRLRPCARHRTRFSRSSIGGRQVVATRITLSSQSVAYESALCRLRVAAHW